MSATLVSSLNPQPPHEPGAETDPDLAPFAGALLGCLMGGLLLALVGTVVRLAV
jgi:predicted lipid-binding transport protein (Tim44 family)